MSEPSKRKMDVFTTNEDKRGGTHFVKIGVAFENPDRSINVVLDANPINGKLHIRDQPKKETNPKNRP